jgi:hypothetical protein
MARAIPKVVTMFRISRSGSQEITDVDTVKQLEAAILAGKPRCYDVV